MDLVVSGILNFLTEQEAIGKADEVQDFYRYGIEITISSMLNIVLVLLMGALTGHLLESVIYLAVFIAVRVITGGYHADTYFRCNLLMCSTFIATALFLPLTPSRVRTPHRAVSQPMWLLLPPV